MSRLFRPTQNNKNMNNLHLKIKFKSYNMDELNIPLNPKTSKLNTNTKYQYTNIFA